MKMIGWKNMMTGYVPELYPLVVKIYWSFLAMDIISIGKDLICVRIQNAYKG